MISRTYRVKIFALMVALAVNANAAPKVKIKGKLDNTDYSVLGTDSDGKGRAPNSSDSGAFNIQGTSRTSSALSLLSDDGNYAGPIVVAIRAADGKIYSTESAIAQGICAAEGTKAITGVKYPSKTSNGKGANLSLGVIKVDADNEYAYITKRLAKKNLVLSASSDVDEECVPEGAGGKLGVTSGEGLVRMSRLLILDENDIDADGVNNPKDLDDDNDGVVDDFDLDSDSDGVQDYNQELKVNNDLDPDEVDYFVYMFTNFQLDFTKAYNMHSMAVSQELIDSRVSEFAGIAMGIVGDSDFEVELDGHGLSYLSTGGSGRITNGPGGQNGEAFPDSYDDDGDGLGRIDEIPSLTGSFDLQMKPNATTDEIKAGDVVSQVFAVNGKEIRRPIMLEFIFHTTPTLTTIKLGENSLSSMTISYPIAEGASGSPGNCFSYNAATDGHKLTFTVERPQRPGILEAGEAEFMDMGNLRYVVSASGTNGGSVTFCPVAAFSTNDSNLTLYSETNGEEGVLDNKGDVPFVQNQSNTLTFSLDLQACTGQASGTHNLTIKARTPRNDNSGQSFCVTRQ